MLTIVPTPIGNLEDITLRALNFLKDSDFIACEDTRRTLKLLARHGIKKKLLRYNEFDEKNVLKIFSLVRGGKKVCLVSDGGSPCVSDPGRKIVKLCRDLGLPVTVLPGPTAFAAAAAGSGMPADSLVFLGFLPKSKTKTARLLEKAFEIETTVVAYESPRRLAKTLWFLSERFGGNLETAVAREISKVFEEWLFGSVREVFERLKGKTVKGEIVLLLRKKE